MSYFEVWCRDQRAQSFQRGTDAEREYAAVSYAFGTSPAALGEDDSATWEIWCVNGIIARRVMTVTADERIAE